MNVKGESVAEFLARGGKIARIDAGVITSDWTDAPEFNISHAEKPGFTPRKGKRKGRSPARD